MFNLHRIQYLTHYKIDHIRNALRISVERGHRRYYMRTRFGQGKQVAQMDSGKRRFPGNYNQRSFSFSITSAVRSSRLRELPQARADTVAIVQGITIMPRHLKEPLAGGAARSLLS